MAKYFCELDPTVFYEYLVLGKEPPSAMMVWYKIPNVTSPIVLKSVFALKHNIY